MTIIKIEESINFRYESKKLSRFTFYSCISFFLVQSDFGNVNVKSHTLHSSNNQFVVYDLYKPSSASKENKAPFIVVVPGFQRSRRHYPT